ncbi:hypothetical protein KUTeg_022361 [Tegillarca granosa]|uniref:C1q domain-containing protein n=1 Tax=Tegillarca granosa TaxID=220873 RepID=A0ABQ9EAD3_TEGGR|nr:hypothetical protein KUTeg_022361 [Tegillarca granosa]
MFITENKITFTAGLQREETYSRLQILKFTKVITNVGGGLNASDGVFYCPEPGLYYFFVNIMSKSNHAYAEIYKNDKLVVYVFTDKNGKQWKSGSNVVILRLEQVNDLPPIGQYTTQLSASLSEVYGNKHYLKV